MVTPEQVCAALQAYDVAVGIIAEGPTFATRYTAMQKALEAVEAVEYRAADKPRRQQMDVERRLKLVATPAGPLPDDFPGRAAFEAEARKRGHSDLSRTQSGCYSDDVLQGAWRMALAALAATHNEEHTR